MVSMVANISKCERNHTHTYKTRELNNKKLENGYLLNLNNKTA